jgi:phosphate butyryltransferase
MALDSAVDRKSAVQKNIGGDVGGDADLLIFPQLESGNVMYKTLAFLSGARSASVVLGAAAPVVLTSRADSIESKLCSIILAAADKTILKD